MIKAYLMTSGGAKKPIREHGERIAINGDKMMLSADGPVATHQHHTWELEDDTFVVMKIETPVWLKLEAGDASDQRGPYEELSIVDGLLLGGLEDEEAIVSFDHDTKTWQEPSGQAWERVIFEKAQ